MKTIAKNRTDYINNVFDTAKVAVLIVDNLAIRISNTDQVRDDLFCLPSAKMTLDEDTGIHQIRYHGNFCYLYPTFVSIPAKTADRLGIERFPAKTEPEAEELVCYDDPANQPSAFDKKMMIQELKNLGRGDIGYSQEENEIRQARISEICRVFHRENSDQVFEDFDFDTAWYLAVEARNNIVARRVS